MSRPLDERLQAQLRRTEALYRALIDRLSWELKTLPQFAKGLAAADGDAQAIEMLLHREEHLALIEDMFSEIGPPQTALRVEDSTALSAKCGTGPNNRDEVVNLAVPFAMKISTERLFRFMQEELGIDNVLVRSMRRSDELKAKGDYKNAIAVLDEAISGSPTGRVLAYMVRAETYLEMDDFASALSDAHKAVELNPSSGTLRHRAKVYLASKNYDAAISDLTRALSDAPPGVLGEIYVSRSEIYGALERYDEAIADITKAIDEEWGNDDAELKYLQHNTRADRLHERAKLYKQSGRALEAAADEKKAEALKVPGTAHVLAEQFISELERILGGTRSQSNLRKPPA